MRHWPSSQPAHKLLYCHQFTGQIYTLGKWWSWLALLTFLLSKIHVTICSTCQHNSTYLRRLLPSLPPSLAPSVQPSVLPTFIPSVLPSFHPAPPPPPPIPPQHTQHHTPQDALPPSTLLSPSSSLPSSLPLLYICRSVISCFRQSESHAPTNPPTHILCLLPSSLSFHEVQCSAADVR